MYIAPNTGCHLSLSSLLVPKTTSNHGNSQSPSFHFLYVVGSKSGINRLATNLAFCCRCLKRLLISPDYRVPKVLIIHILGISSGEFQSCLLIFLTLFFFFFFLFFCSWATTLKTVLIKMAFHFFGIVR